MNSLHLLPRICVFSSRVSSLGRVLSERDHCTETFLSMGAHLAFVTEAPYPATSQAVLATGYVGYTVTQMQ